MLISKGFFGLGIFLVLTLLGSACSGGGTDPTATSTDPTATGPAPLSTSPGSTESVGTLENRVTDKPNPSISAINLTAENVEVHRSDTGEWSTVVEGPITFDLIAVTGIEELLGSETLPAGEYTQIRLSITSVIIVDNGEEVEAQLPSDVLKVVRPFTITAGLTTIATLDFDAEQSVVKQGNGGYLLRPVVTLLVRQEGEPFVPADQPDDTPMLTPTIVPTPTATPDATGDFFLTIEEPLETESIIAESSITVTGRTRLDATLSVNDIFADIDGDGRFMVTVDLEIGPNIIEVVASLSTGEALNEVLVVIYSP
ncbi:MAG: DUF4382 domain-containing protein [Chloroflexi bacterium]|nr:DUF4382 domain-containing protein [Chloroflexota bacterium]